MDAADHDGKCEIRRQDTILEVFGSWEEFRKLPEEAQKLITEKTGIDGPVSGCKCARRKKNHDDLIRLWTAASPAKNYNKAAWKDVEGQLFNADEI